MEKNFNFNRQKRYAALTAGKDVLELGGGAGDFNKACEGIAASIVSIDNDPHDKRVKKADIFGYLSRNKKKYDMIYARHVIEHFAPEKIQSLFSLCADRLKKGGELVLIFPNMKNINVATYEFWCDPTHVRPYTDTAVISLLKSAGFEISQANQDSGSWDNSKLKQAVSFLRFLFTGIKPAAPDYYIIAKKR